MSCLALEFSNLHKKVPTINEGKHNMMKGILGKICMLALSRNLIADDLAFLHPQELEPEFDQIPSFMLQSRIYGRLEI